jgi:hypothetical protein
MLLRWQALDEEGSVSIFQTVSDLRRQRNYLVQSVKQYQFVYRSVRDECCTVVQSESQRQGCGSGFAWSRIVVRSWIRIRIKVKI